MNSRRFYILTERKPNRNIFIHNYHEKCMSFRFNVIANITCCNFITVPYYGIIDLTSNMIK